MPFDQFFATVRHPRTPNTAEVDFSLSAQKPHRHAELEGSCPWQVQTVIGNNGDRDNQRLANFSTIDSGEDVDAVRAKCG